MLYTEGPGDRRGKFPSYYISSVMSLFVMASGAGADILPFLPFPTIYLLSALKASSPSLYHFSLIPPPPDGPALENYCIAHANRLLW